MLLLQILLSHQAEKTTLIWKKYFLNRSFLKIMVGTFCANCTVTEYPCWNLILLQQIFFSEILLDIVIRKTFMVKKISWLCIV